METLATVLARAATFGDRDDHTKFTSAQWNNRVLDRRIADLVKIGDTEIAEVIAEHTDRTNITQVLQMIGRITQLLIAHDQEA